MSATMTLTGDWLSSIGNVRQTSGTGNLGVYATGGLTVSAPTVGLGRIVQLIVDPAGGYTFKYNSSTGKLQAFAGNGGVASHTHDITIIGSKAPSTTNDIAHYATDILGKEAATNATIAGADSATKGGIGSANSTTGVEVANAVDLTAALFNWRATGV